MAIYKTKKQDILDRLDSLAKENFILSSNIDYIHKITEFLFDEKNDFCGVTGKSGTYKTEIINFVLNNFDQDTIIFKYKFYPASTVDDVFLSFFNDLKLFHRLGLIKEPKLETNSMVQKISSFLSHVNRRVIIFFDSVENIAKENSITIKNFIEYLTKQNKIKVLIAGRKIEDERLYKVEIAPHENIEKLMEYVDIPCTKEECKILYEKADRDINYIFYAISIIKTLNITYKELFSEYKAKNLSFQNFIIHKLLSLVPDKYKMTLQILSLINIALPEEFLLSYNLITKEQLAYLIEKLIITKEYGLIYLKQQIKDYVAENISHFNKIKTHKLLKDFYESQLPEKPSNRIAQISRVAMREQIKYHSSFIPEIMPSKKENINTSLLSYMSGNTDWSLTESLSEKKKAPRRRAKKEESVESKYKLTKEELALLGIPVDLSSNNNSVQNNNQKIEKLNIEKVLDEALSFERKHEYLEAFEKYNTAYLNIEEKNPVAEKILDGLIRTSLKTNKTDSAVLYCNRLIEYYNRLDQKEKSDNTLLKLGKIYKDSYKYSPAKKIYETFIKNPKKYTTSTVAYSYIAMAEIEEDTANLENAVLYYQKAFHLAPEVKDRAFLAEAYFKYALILDDNAIMDKALLYYERCSDIKEKNPFLSSAYTNIAEIYKETGDVKNSIKNYTLALKEDIAAANYDGIYYLCKRLSEIFKTRDLKKALNYALKALSAAKRLKENVYIISSYISAGDCYYNIQNKEKALKAYLLANKFAKINNLQIKNAAYIEKRINEQKIVLDDEVYEKIVREVNAI